MRGYDYFCWSVALFYYYLAISVLPIFLNRPHVGIFISLEWVCFHFQTAERSLEWFESPPYP